MRQRLLSVLSDRGRSLAGDGGDGFKEMDHCYFIFGDHSISRGVDRSLAETGNFADVTFSCDRRLFVCTVKAKFSVGGCHPCGPADPGIWSRGCALVFGSALVVLSLLPGSLDSYGSRRQLFLLGGLIVLISGGIQAYLQFVRFRNLHPWPSEKVIALSVNLHTGICCWYFLSRCCRFCCSLRFWR